MFILPCIFQAQTFAQVLESNEEDSDQKAITAMGILSTLETIVTVMEDQKTVSRSYLINSR